MRAHTRRRGGAPQDVDLIECHADRNTLGDAVEVASLKSMWQKIDGGSTPGQCV